MRSQHQQMRDAINDVELALNGLEIDDVVRLFEGADDSVMVKMPLGALRQLGRCFPEVNRIINDPAFQIKQAAELPLADKTVSELIKLAEDCYEEITRRALAAINGPPGQVRS
jgi:hypothetical protein